MENEKRYDLVLNGVGNASGGLYNNVTINGVGSVDGDLECIDFSCDGVSTVNGGVKANSTSIRGKSAVKGAVQSKSIFTSGYIEIGSVTSSGEVKIEGAVKVNGGLSAEEVEVRGSANIKGDCSAESFVSKGGFNIDGMLNAGNIEVDLYAPCRAKEIGGEKINIRKGNTFPLRRLIRSILPMLDIGDGLNVQLIEGDDIYLEYTRAKVVRGNNVVIGAGCEIELVEYKKSFEQVENTKVIESRKL